MRIVLVEPQYELNIGFIARVMDNFGQKELYLVNPKTGIGFTSKVFGKHSGKILSNAKKAGSLDKALEGMQVAVATTGVPKKFGKSLKTCFPLAEVVEKTASAKKIALVFGSEGSGLSRSDLLKCDFIATIPANKKNSVLNLSHAVAIVLYSFFNFKGRKRVLLKTADRKLLLQLQKMFSQTVHELGYVKNKQRVSNAFSQVVARALITDAEAKNLIAAIAGIKKGLK